MKKNLCPVLEIGIEMLIVTSLIASVLTIFFVKLSFAVIALRRKNRVALGTGGQEELERAIRAQGNFAEYVPISLILTHTHCGLGAQWCTVVVGGCSWTHTDHWASHSCQGHQRTSP